MDLNQFFTVNHEEAKGGEFPPLPIGEYEVIVSNAEIKESKNGNPMIKLEMTVRDDLDQEGKRRKIWDQLVFTEGAKWRIQQAYKAFGFDNGHKFSSLQDVAKALLYKPVRVKIKHEKYTNDQGDTKITERVDYYMNSHVPNVAVQTGADPFAIPSSATAVTPSNPFPDPFAGMAPATDVKPPFEI